MIFRIEPPHQLGLQFQIMRKVSVLVSLMLIEDLVDVREEVSRILNLPLDCFSVHAWGDHDDLAVQINDLKINFMQIEDIIQQNNRSSQRIDRLKDIIRPYEERPSISVDTDIQSLLRKAKKLKQFKEENKKLRHLLRVQLESTEKIREQTQNTMLNLKEEFDILVKEMQRMGMSKMSADYASRFEIHLD